MPAYLHEVFGERQSIGVIGIILLFGAGITFGLYVIFPELVQSVPLWRSVLALLLIFDIIACSISNFTKSTNNYYAERRNLRLVFISVHVHIVLIALLLEVDYLNSSVVWAYTIGGAFIVNALSGRRSQRFVAAMLLTAGIAFIPLLPDMQTYMLTVCLLFMLKVLYGFAVDHYAADRSEERAIIP